MNRLEDAIIFAAKAHEGQVRKMAAVPYILHPLEVASIIATLTPDLDIMAAGVLHDVIEDCGIEPSEIEEKFGRHVLDLVLSETEDKLHGQSPAETWQVRKEESIKKLKNTQDKGVKILWLGDKLSNMRSFYREYLERGDEVWQKLNQKDPKKQEWYYRTIAECVSVLSGTVAYDEYVTLVNKIFDGR